MSDYKKSKVTGFFIFRASMRMPNGVVLYAKDFGLKAFRIFVPEHKKS